MTLAEQGRGSVAPNPLVGAVLLRSGKIIARDYHRKYGEGHAERNLLEKFTGKILSSDVLGVTLEPCCHVGNTPPCTDIILEKNIKNVVIGLQDPNPKVAGRGIKILKTAGVKVSMIDDKEMIEKLRWQNRFFFTWIHKRRPWVAVKIAQSLDGRVTFDRGTQLWLTGKESKKHVQAMRSQFDAILVGVKTVMVDNPKLKESPHVVVLDAALSIPLNRELVRPGTLIFCGRQFKRRKTKKEQLQAKGCVVVEADTNAEGFLNLREVLHELATRGIASVFVEGGPSVWSSFLRQNLADELMMYFAPKVLGGGVQTFEGLGFNSKAVRFRELKQLGQDVFWHGYFEKNMPS